MKGMKKTVILAFSIMALLALTIMVAAVPTVEYVKIDGDIHESGDTLVVERGETLDIRVKLQAGNTGHDDVEVEADILGYEYNDRTDDLSDSSSIFDMDAGETRFESLEIKIPVKADKDIYDLRVRVASRSGPSIEQRFRVSLEGNRHELEIRDVLLHPRVVEAGSSLLVNVRTTNRGEKDEEDVKVTASIPALGLTDSDYIGELEADESETSEELFMRIPACAQPGKYTLDIEVEYDEGFESTSASEVVEVIAGRLCGESDDSSDEGKTIISVGSQTQQLVAGKGGATYSIAITNAGRNDKTYSIAVSGVDSWGTYRVDPSTTTLVRAGETKPVFVFVSANENSAAGQQSFVVTVNSGTQSEPVQFNAVVAKGESNVRQWAEFVLIALVVLLIILGLIIGFSRMRSRDDSSDDDEEISGQTYY